MPRPRNLRAANVRELQRADVKLDGFQDNIYKIAYAYDQHKAYQQNTMGVVSEHTDFMLESCVKLTDMVTLAKQLIALMIEDINKG